MTPSSFHALQAARCILQRIVFSWITAAGIVFSPPAPSLALSVGVIYPDVRQPYRQIFENILTGVDQGLGTYTKHYRINSEPDSAQLRRWINDEEIDTVVALGSGGLKAAQMVGGDVNIVVGAVHDAPASAGFPGIVLTPDPRALFQRLKALAPRVTSVTVVYNPERSQWLIDIARRAAEAHDLQLQALIAQSLQEAALLYRELLSDTGDGTRALWLLQDPTTLDEQAILPLILQEAWGKNLIVFSSNPAHVQRGVLFSLFPDNVGMGQSLALMAKKVAQENKGKTATIVPLQDLFIAVNLRTADHLGLKFSARQQRDFKLVFPSR